VLPRANAGKDWKVSNYGGTEQGVLDLIQATKVSSNTVFAQLMLEVGPENVAPLAERMGITSKLPVVNSLVLGSGEVSVLDMASAYSTFADRGEHVEPTAITRIEQVDDQGRVSVIEQSQPRRQRVLTQQESDLVTHCLRGVIQGGTGTAAGFGKQAAGKTGTTQDNRDAWFVGYTPKLTAAVWMGYVGKPGAPVRFMDDVHGRAVTGGSFPAEIWQRFMRNATSGVSTGSFVAPKAFPGKILNSKLSTTSSSQSTTSTAPTASTTSTTSQGPTTTAPPPTTTTTIKPKPPPTSSTTGSTLPPPPSTASPP
jgi:penicillin-binding protein 1A